MKYVFGTLTDFDSTKTQLKDLDEGYRLLYVLFTRARDCLFLTSYKYRGKEEKNYLPNRYVKSIEEFDSLDLIA